MSKTRYMQMNFKDLIEESWETDRHMVMSCDDAGLALHYIKNFMIEKKAETAITELEQIIMKDPAVSVHYAKDIIKDRWLEAEPVIMKDGGAVLMYVVSIIKERWTDAEPTIMQDPYDALMYAEHVIKGRWIEAEPTISQDPCAAVWYAKTIMKSRWSDAESTIAQDPHASVIYAREIMKGRFISGEQAIMTNTSCIIDYASNIIRGRWLEAEHVILKSLDSIMTYVDKVVKTRWPECEETIMTMGGADAMFRYATICLTTRPAVSTAAPSMRTTTGLTLHATAAPSMRPTETRGMSFAEFVSRKTESVPAFAPVTRASTARPSSFSFNRLSADSHRDDPLAMPTSNTLRRPGFGGFGARPRHAAETESVRPSTAHEEE